MTNEDKKIVADYMGWKYESDRNCIVSEGENHRRIAHNLDLNDAGLVVKEMQKRDDWMSFITFADNEHFDKEISVEFSAWLFNAGNFFEVFVEWRKAARRENNAEVSRRCVAPIGFTDLL